MPLPWDLDRSSLVTAGSTRPKTTTGAPRPITPYTPSTQGTGTWVQDQTTGPGGSSMNMNSPMDWMAPTSPLLVNPGNDRLEAINATRSAPLQTMGSARTLSTRWDPPTTTTGGGWTPPYLGGFGGGGGGGGGGGSAGYQGPMIDDATFRAIIDQIRRTRPSKLQHNALDLNAPDFYAFDRGPFEALRRGLDPAYRDDLQRGMGAYGEAQGELNRWQNPYSRGASTLDPGVRSAMERMFAANEADTGVLDQLDWLAQNSNDAMQATHGMLAGAAQERNAANRRALSGDQRRFREGLDAEKRQVGTGIDMALANALSQYGKDRFGYESNNAIAQAMANWQRANQVSDTNVGNINAFRNTALQPIMDLLLSGLFEGKQTLDLDYMRPGTSGNRA